jgi:hypothetical protein
MLHLLQDEDHSVRELTANIVPKIAQADWPNDWPGFLEQLSSVIQSSTQPIQVISVLKVLRGILPHTPAPQYIHTHKMEVDLRIHFGDVDG